MLHPPWSTMCRTVLCIEYAKKHGIHLHTCFGMMSPDSSQPSICHGHLTSNRQAAHRFASLHEAEGPTFGTLSVIHEGYAVALRRRRGTPAFTVCSLPIASSRASAPRTVAHPYISHAGSSGARGPGTLTV